MSKKDNDIEETSPFCMPKFRVYTRKLLGIFCVSYSVIREKYNVSPYESEVTGRS